MISKRTIELGNSIVSNTDTSEIIEIYNGLEKFFEDSGDFLNGEKFNHVSAFVLGRAQGVHEERQRRMDDEYARGRDAVDEIGVGLEKIKGITNIIHDYFEDWGQMATKNDLDGLAYEVSRTLSQITLLIYMLWDAWQICEKELEIITSYMYPNEESNRNITD